MASIKTQYVRRQRPQLDKISIILLAVFTILAVITAIVAFNLVRDMVSSWKATSIEGIAIDPSTGQSQTNQTTEGNSSLPGSDTPLQTDSGLAPSSWDGASRINLLIMGLDYRDWEAGETPRTDSMMLLTLDPITRTAGMLSIPRDLWVNIPGYDYAKINTAYYLGEVYKLPGGGPALAVKTVEELLGVQIDYYAQIDFMAFVKFIDEIGGVKVNIEEPITLYLMTEDRKVPIEEPGWYTLPGEYALAYARNRYTDGGDFDRSRRQQQVIMAVRDRILDFNMLPTLVAKAPALYRDLSSGIATNLTLDQVIKLGWLASQVPAESITSKVIGTQEVEMATSPDGLAILIPYHDKIRLLRDEVFTTGGPVGPAAVAEDPAKLMQEEAARIEIQNGTMTTGLAGRTSEYLKSKGLTIVSEGNANSTSVTSIYLYNGKPYTVRYLIEALGLVNPRIYNQLTPDSQVDVVIVLGEDFAQSNPLP